MSMDAVGPMCGPKPGDDAPDTASHQISTIIKKQLDNINDDKINAKSLKKALRKVLELTEQLHEEATAASTLMSNKMGLESSLQSISQAQKQYHTDISKRISKLEQTKTWASVAAKEALPPSIAKTSPPPTVGGSSISTAASPPESRREERDVIVNINKRTDQQQTPPPPTAHGEVKEKERQTLELANRAIKTSTITSLKGCTIGAARQLPSGDWRFTTATPREAEVLKAHAQDWVRAIGAEATVAVPTYGAIIDGVRLDTVNMDDPKETIAELKKQNHRVLTGCISRIHWLQKPRKGKAFASLVMDFTSQADANAAINAGELFWHNETRKVRRFIRSASLNQCYKCHKYGHRSTQCRNPPSCGFCAKGDHVTAACPSQSQPMAACCPNCRKGHPAWSPDCGDRKNEKKKIRERIDQAPKFWTEPPRPVSLSPGPSVATDTNFTASTRQTKKATGTVKAGTKRPLAEKSTNESTKISKTSNNTAKDVVPYRPQEQDENAMVDIDNDEEGSSNLSQVSSSGERRSTRAKKTPNFTVYSEEL